jgi:hypothetical protein
VDERTQARFTSFGRAAAGAALLLAPERTGRLWIGPVAERRAAKVAIMALGVRDLALGLATEHVLRMGEPSRHLLRLNAMVDVADVAATLGAGRAVPLASRAAVAAVGGIGSLLWTKWSTELD